MIKIKFPKKISENKIKDFFVKAKKIASKKEDFPAPFLPMIKFFDLSSEVKLLKDLKLLRWIFLRDIPS